MGVSDKIIEYVGFDKFLQFIKELPIFYLKPNSFFRKFYKKEFEEKFLQVLFYIILLIFLGYFSIQDISLRELVGFVIFELSSLFTTILILSASFHVISIYTNYTFSLQKVTFFSVLAKILIAPFQIVFFGLFVTFENYNYYFIHNLIVLVLYIYIFFYSANIFYKRLRHIAAGIFLNIFFLNILIFGLSLSSIDEYSTFESQYYVDQILKERAEKGEPIKNYFKYPTHRILWKKDGKTVPYYTFKVPVDTVASGSMEESFEYRQDLKSNISHLKRIREDLKFERNEEFFDKTLSLYKKIDSLMSSKYVEYTKKEIDKVTVYVTKEEEKKLYEEVQLPLPDFIDNEMVNLAMKQQELNRTSYSSTIPLALVQYLMPVYYIIETNPEPELSSNYANS